MTVGIFTYVFYFIFNFVNKRSLQLEPYQPVRKPSFQRYAVAFVFVHAYLNENLDNQNLQSASRKSRQHLVLGYLLQQRYG